MQARKKDGMLESWLVRVSGRVQGIGYRVMRLAVDGQLASQLAVSDPIKARTLDALTALRRSGLRIVMVTGDGLTTALAVGKRLGIDEVHGEVKAADNLMLVERLQSEGRMVTMAGATAKWRPNRRTWYDAKGWHLRLKQLEFYGKLP